MIRVGHLEVFIDIYTINGSVFGTGNNKIEERQDLRCSWQSSLMSFLFFLQTPRTA